LGSTLRIGKSKWGRGTPRHRRTSGSGRARRRSTPRACRGSGGRRGAARWWSIPPRYPARRGRCSPGRASTPARRRGRVVRRELDDPVNRGGSGWCAGWQRRGTPRGPRVRVLLQEVSAQPPTRSGTQPVAARSVEGLLHEPVLASLCRPRDVLVEDPNFMSRPLLLGPAAPMRTSPRRTGHDRSAHHHGRRRRRQRADDHQHDRRGPFGVHWRLKSDVPESAITSTRPSRYGAGWPRRARQRVVDAAHDGFGGHRDPGAGAARARRSPRGH